jgi:hypothetical protein
MSAVLEPDKTNNRLERRKFPRIAAQCPIRYRGLQGDWGEAELQDYSATGLRMMCEETLLQNTKLSLQLLPGEKTRIPRVTAEGVVVRCILGTDHRYEIACKLIKVKHDIP